MKRVFVAIIIVFVIQLPFLILMNIAGVHSALGAAWGIFYLPAIWLMDKMEVPAISPFVTILVVTLLQEIILLIVILPLVVVWVRLKQRKKKSV